MQLAVSAIAWESSQDEDVANMLKMYNVPAVELAPTKIWPDLVAKDPNSVTDSQISEALDVWRLNGIKPVAMQSMLFLRPDLKIFENEQNRNATLDYLKSFISLSSRMQIARMVFGSPKNRQKGGLGSEDALDIAIAFFKEIGDYAHSKGVIFCIEPNAPDYGCDFIVNADEGAELVRQVNSPGFMLHLDAACMALAKDDLGKSIRQYKDILAHYHVSSPMLQQIESNSEVDHKGAAVALVDIGYDQTISIEMRPDKPELNLKRLEKAINFTKQTYLV